MVPIVKDDYMVGPDAGLNAFCGIIPSICTIEANNCSYSTTGLGNKPTAITENADAKAPQQSQTSQRRNHDGENRLVFTHGLLPYERTNEAI